MAFLSIILLQSCQDFRDFMAEIISTSTSASWSDRMDAEDADEAENIPLNINMNSGTDWLSGNRMKKNFEQRCAKIREFEAEINKCSANIKGASALI
ncbi:hypothetical protein AVEN_25351-1 [Araneus ventricosus]|uniref:Uncharacterized protein n=1 Tax=Araneus ventricosus TaxID=182803 RepID=A0A4Y2EF07_ARAVE|nr:hypothetical protein AVEN_25351-1 [Araneus ventricosus]